MPSTRRFSTGPEAIIQQALNASLQKASQDLTLKQKQIPRLQKQAYDFAGAAGIAKGKEAELIGKLLEQALNELAYAQIELNHLQILVELLTSAMSLELPRRESLMAFTEHEKLSELVKTCLYDKRKVDIGFFMDARCCVSEHMPSGMMIVSVEVIPGGVAPTVLPYMKHNHEAIKLLLTDAIEKQMTAECIFSMKDAADGLLFPLVPPYYN